MKGLLNLGLAATFVVAIAGAGIPSACLTVTKTCTATKTVHKKHTTVVAGSTCTEASTITATKSGPAGTRTLTHVVTTTVRGTSTIIPVSTYYLAQSTVTIAPTTTTAFPPAGFTPIKATIPAAYDPQKRDENAAGIASSQCTTTKDVTKTTTVTKFAKHTVTSTDLKSVTTVKIKTTVTKSASYVLATDTITTTITSQPHVGTGTTTVPTGTIYETVAVATYFAACNNSNMLTTLEDGGITNNAQRIFQEAYYNQAGSAYDCCLAAIRGSYGGAAYGILPADGQYVCALIPNSTETCTPKSINTGFQMLLNGGFNVTLSNSYCGAWIYQGVYTGSNPPVDPPA